MKNQIKAGSILSYTQLFLTVIIGIVYTPIMIRLLGQSEYGLYNTVASVISIVGLLSLGFNAGYLRYYMKYKAKEETQSIYKLNGLFLLIFLILGSLTLACGLFLSFHLDFVFGSGLKATEYRTAKILMLILSCNLAISFPTSVFSNIINAHERFVFLKSINVLKTLVGPMVTLPFLLMGYRSIAMVTITVSVSLLADCIYIFFVFAKLKMKFRFRGFEKGIFKSLFVYTSFIALHLIVDQINWNVDKLLLARFKGTETVAVYSVGYSLYSYYVMIGCPIADLFRPRVYRIVEETNEDKVVREQRLTTEFTKVGRVQFALLALLASGVVFFGQPFLKFWVGAGYEQSYYVALLLILPGTIDLIQNIGIDIQRALNLHKFRAIVYVCMALINVVVSFFLCQAYGAVGSAIGTALSLIFVQGIVINVYYHKKCCLNMRFYWKQISSMCLGLIIPIMVGVCLMLFVQYNSIFALLAGIAVYTLVYALSMFFIGLNRYEKGLIKEPLIKVFKRK